MRRAILLAALLVSACGDWPDLGVGGEAPGFPRLVPFDQVVAPGESVGDAAGDAAEADAALLARADGLRARAAAAAPSDEDRDAFDALRGRAPVAR